MESVFNVLRDHPIMEMAAAIYLVAMIVLISVIGLRRWLRARYFARRDARAYALRQCWPEILSGAIPAAQWRNEPLDREVVETILLDSIDAATEEALPPLVGFLRSSGLLDVRLHDARNKQGWPRRSALVALGRTRAVEAIPALTDALDSPDIDVRTAAVRGLGAIELTAAAVPILERLASGELNAPAAAVSTALALCCQKDPRKLLRYFYMTTGPGRELLARVLAELDLAMLGEELISLSKDQSPEVRACAARGLPKLHASIAVPTLIDLLEDDTWFVRLRAVVALGSLGVRDVVEPLIRSLRDPNRLVRQRAAAALVRRSDQVRSILHDAIALNDDFGLQALVSELDRTGDFDSVLRALTEREEGPLSRAIRNAQEALHTRRAKAAKS